MKNLKTVVILIAVLLFTQVLFAQLLPTFIIKGGISSASLTNKDEYVKYSEVGDNRVGYTFGLGVELPIALIIKFETGLLYAQKGTKGKVLGVDVEFSPAYLEVPLGFRAVVKAGGIGVYGSLGTYLAYGIGGKTKGEFDLLGVNFSDSRDISWGSDNGDDLKPFDFGFNVGAGVVLGQLEAGLYSSGSFINISPVTNNDRTMRNIVFGVMFGYRI